MSSGCRHTQKDDNFQELSGEETSLAKRMVLSEDKLIQFYPQEEAQIPTLTPTPCPQGWGKPVDIASFPFGYRCGMAKTRTRGVRSHRSGPCTCHLPNPPGSLACPWCWARPGTIDRNDKAQASHPPGRLFLQDGHGETPVLQEGFSCKRKKLSTTLIKEQQSRLYSGHYCCEWRARNAGLCHRGQRLGSTLTQQGKVDRYRQGSGWV